jgi:hypothetical protein
MTNKKNVMHWGTLKYHLEQVTNNFIQNFVSCKSVFGEKGHAIFFQNNPFGS